MSKKDKPVGGILSYLNANEKDKKPSKPKAPTASQKTAQNLLDAGIFEPIKKENKKSDDPWLDAVRIDGADDGANSRTAQVAQPTKKVATSKVFNLSER